MTDFNLSEKIDVSCPLCPNENINTRDVKEFIRLLKDEIQNNPPVDTTCGEWEFDEQRLYKIIDKLAGSKLIP
jgi:hypothetical protein